MAVDTVPNSLLTPDELERLLSRGHRTIYSAGSVLIHEGDHSDHVFYLLSGHVKAVTVHPEGFTQIYMPGSIIGELAVLTGRVRSADIIALSDVEACLLTGKVWLEFIRNEPRANIAMLRNLASRVIAADISQANHAQNSEARLVRGLLRLVESGYGRKVVDGYLIPGITQRELGAFSGISRESVAIALRRMRRERLVTTGRGRLVIHDLDAVKRLPGNGDGNL
ncbi:Crp/Fnr family transcriptional regulator [Glycomyces tenuis]|uniref:Crp/Fnr family transcriptional regulator n=1 Tax=Glycomyces tenuis TaxID=58116 RepID=UPI0003F84A8C|nr:Crp/Fnr family transcriptional regulator [Glycomyces tenuis]